MRPGVEEQEGRRRRNEKEKENKEKGEIAMITRCKGSSVERVERSILRQYIHAGLAGIIRSCIHIHVLWALVLGFEAWLGILSSLGYVRKP